MEISKEDFDEYCRAVATQAAERLGPFVDCVLADLDRKRAHSHYAEAHLKDPSSPDTAQLWSEYCRCLAIHTQQLETIEKEYYADASKKDCNANRPISESIRIVERKSPPENDIV